MRFYSRFKNKKINGNNPAAPRVLAGTSGARRLCHGRRLFNLTKEHIMMDRRGFIRLTAVGGGAVFMSGLYGTALADTGYEDFYFVQLSDSHWGFKGPANPDAHNTLKLRSPPSTRWRCRRSSSSSPAT
jgi:hypothetical protein